MSSDPRAGCVRSVAAASSAVAAVLLAGAVAVDGRLGPAAAGVAAGVAGSFVILGLRVRSVSDAMRSGSAAAAARGAFLVSLGKMAVAFAALSAGAQFGARGAIGALAGLLTTGLAAAGEGVWAALRKR